MGLFRRRATVDPVDFLALRAELQDVKARLEASEQAKAYLEARLGSLDATTTALSSNASNNTEELGWQITSLLERVNAAEVEASHVATLQRRVDDVELRQSATIHDPVVDDLAPQLTQLASRLEEVAQLVGTSAVSNGDTAHVSGESEAELRARIEELAANAATVDVLAQQLQELSGRVGEQSTLVQQLEQLDQRISAQATLAEQVDQLSTRVEEQSTFAQQLEQLNGQVAVHTSLAQQIDDLTGRVHEQHELAAQLNELSAKVQEQAGVAQQISHLDGRLAEHASLAQELEALNERIGRLQAQAGESDEVRMRVDRLAESSAGTEALADQLAQLAERVAISANDARQAKEQAAALDARIASVGTELANQLSELGKEIDALAGDRSADAPAAVQTEVSDEVLAAIRAGQARLANEQARYEIAFREDLAMLADQVRLLRGGR